MPFTRHFLPVFAATFLFGAGARAESIFPVNEIVGNNRIFDQPSVAANGSTIHVAFVGPNAGNTDTTLYYAAVNGAANFASAATTRSQAIVTPAVAIDNGPYSQARHPQIAVRSANQVVILFQASPVGSAGTKLFRALVSLDNNAVRTQVVDEVRDSSGASVPGFLTDASFGLVTSDDTMRVAYSSSPSLLAPVPYADVHYARVGIDNARVVGDPIPLTGTPGGSGILPLPRLRLDGLNRSHIAWAANSVTVAPSGVYYALVKQSATGPDTLAIGATQVLAGGYRWGFPNVLVAGNSRILVLAADEPSGTAVNTGLAGPVGVSLLNPDGVVQNGLPVNISDAGSNATFFLSPQGQSVLDNNFNAYRPEAALDGSNRVYVAGYGSPGTTGRFYAMSVSGVTTTTGTIAGYAEMVTAPLPVGDGDRAFAGWIEGDYTRPAFVRFNGKTVLFWSGPEIDSAGRNLYVTSVPSAADPVPPPTSANQSGCSVVDDPVRGEAGRVPGAAALLLPAALLGLRRYARKAFGR